MQSKDNNIQDSKTVGKKNRSFHNNSSIVNPNKKVYIVMTFESGHFLYDLMTFLSDYVILYRDTLKDGNMKETAKDLTVARNTLDRLVKEHKPLSWDCFQDILSGLLVSNCPYPQNQQILICESNPISSEIKNSCLLCRYYQFYQNCEKGVDFIRDNFYPTSKDKQNSNDIIADKISHKII